VAQTIPIARSQYLVTLKSVDAYWQSFSGLSDEAQTTQYSDGLGNRTYTLVGARQAQNVTLTKAFDPVADKQTIDWYKNYCAGTDQELTISVVPVKYCPEPEPIGPSLILYGCKPVSLKFGEADKTSNDVSMIEISFAVDLYEYQ
jgi:hypothetical protein